MGDKIRKIGGWFWRNKERLILAVMVIYLGTRVYEVFKEQEVDTTFISPPRPLTKEKIDELVEAGKLPPEAPATPPKSYPYGQYNTLATKNPFYYNATTQGNTTDQAQQWDLEVLRVAEPEPGKIRVKIRHGSVNAWYDEGESFAEYRTSIGGHGDQRGHHIFDKVKRNQEVSGAIAPQTDSR